MTEPTGLEHVTPVEVATTSATERATFRKCRRQWFLTVVHRLETMEGNLNFWLGEIVHAGLQRYYEGQRDGEPHAARAEAALARYEEAYGEALAPLAGVWGAVWSLARPMYEDLGAMGFDMLFGYFERELTHPLAGEGDVIQVEQRLFVPILDPEGLEAGRLSVRTDLFVRRFGDLTAVDHKTASQRLGSSMLDIDDQLTAEVYAGWKALGEFPERAVYNALLKKRPGPPKEIKGTKAEPVKLSKDKSQPTTHALYSEAIAERGLDPANYQDILDLLLENEVNDTTPFFYREETFRTPGQMAQFEQNLYHEFADMVDVAAHPERAYPAPSPFACPSCPVRQVCAAMMDETDPAHLIKSQYIVAEPRY